MLMPAFIPHRGITHRLARGFTLTELMIALAVAGILTVLAFPDFRIFMANGKIRNTAVSIQSGAQLARAEAIKRNQPVEFLLFDSGSTLYTSGLAGSMSSNTSGPNWLVRAKDPVSGSYTHVDWYNGYEGSGRSPGDGSAPPTPINATISDSAGDNIITFNGLGGTNLTSMAKFDVTSDVNGTRPLRVTVSVAGTVKLCDPSISVAGDPRTCPN